MILDIQQREREQEERQQLNNIIKKSESEIDKLLDKKSEYQLEVKNFEVEVGPIKYIAALIYGDEKNYLDNTVRYVILLLIFVFDPLAVLLLISANNHTEKN